MAISEPAISPLSDSGPAELFAAFAAGVQTQTLLRSTITAAYRRSEPDCLPTLVAAATLSPSAAQKAEALARQLVEALRRKKRSGGVDGLIHEYALSSQEGVALMCLAEALLRIPDVGTRDALIRDKIAPGDWRAHLGRSPSLFVNAATWGLVVTGRLTATNSETTLSAALTRLIGKGGEPLIRRGVDMAMRMMGEQFVLGQTIDEAVTRGRRMEAKGFRYSYDMLGEAAATAEDAARYLTEYEAAIHAIGKASKRRGILEGAGISIKLSALHPRYSRAQQDRVIRELLPRLLHLARMARGYDIGLNIDAEEADRLELSLDLLEALCQEPALAGWGGIGFVVQAYQKRAFFVLDWVIDLARRTGHRIMLRLVKGAYWDSEIKRAQVDGQDGFPVFTRKVYTDVSYLACARKLLDAPDAIFPQFATHNAQTLAAIIAMASEPFSPGQYEFQCLHGMGEPLYEEVVGAAKLGRPCRIYAPVGTHETLLAYLVRRLLENGANSSFVNRIADSAVAIDDLIADPVTTVRAQHANYTPHPAIALPSDVFRPDRANSAGLDLSNEQTLALLATVLIDSRNIAWRTQAPSVLPQGIARPILNPADRRDEVGTAWDSSGAELESALSRAAAAASAWAGTAAAERAAILARAADELEARRTELLGLLVREAGKTLPNAIGEVREAADFLRYYGVEAARQSGVSGRPLGPVACISPWNFPLAIFTGQVAAALAAGNPVLAKPAEETPLVATEAVRIFHESGIPPDVLQLIPGVGATGAALVADARVQGVVFTGSTSVARAIQKQLAGRLSTDGTPIPLIAETGGQNALVVDSSALAEQVVADVLASAFDSAGQRCSALRILCLQDDTADRTLAMLRGAMRELTIGRPDSLDVDIGPVISAEAQAALHAHIQTMRERGHKVEALPLPDETRHGTFVAPTLIEISAIADVEREVFGPILHVLRFDREKLDALIDEVNATGYGLTFGLHTRIDETVARVTARVRAGNVYVNRNIIGAVVGSQPFGGGGLSGTGPKAGGPLYLRRLMTTPGPGHMTRGLGCAAGDSFAEWLRKTGRDEAAKRCKAYLDRSPLNVSTDLPGPAGERNVYQLHPRGCIAAVSQTEAGLLDQLGAILATGNTALVDRRHPSLAALTGLPPDLARHVVVAADWLSVPDIGGVLFEGDGDALMNLNAEVAARPGAILTVQNLPVGETGYCLDWLLEEVSTSTNTAAAGGNATLMAIT
jgi:RHH-type transcriptional regulator, proline utilization regulon repressor / proline dehydrogenase / delta 1-pyrroline-5-carboxylate dehydrogenase